MADNVPANAGTGGATFAADDIAGIHFPRTKLIHGADGVNAGDVSTANPLPVVQTGALPAGTANIGDVDVLTLPGVAGTVAHDAADSGNPVKVGGVARSTNPTAVADGDRVNFYADLFGKQVVLPYSIPESLTRGSAGPITTTTSTSVIAAGGAGLRNYVTAVMVTNSHATVGTLVTITDGSGGATLWHGYAGPIGGGFAIAFSSALRGTAATAIHAVCGTTGASVYVSAAGYLAP
jgi:hypothetical protein